MEAITTLTLSDGDGQAATGAEDAGRGRGKIEKTEVVGEMELNGKNRYLWSCM